MTISGIELKTVERAEEVLGQLEKFLKELRTKKKNSSNLLEKIAYSNAIQGAEKAIFKIRNDCAYLPYETANNGD
jgi:hypothetical protein